MASDKIVMSGEDFPMGNFLSYPVHLMQTTLLRWAEHLKRMEESRRRNRPLGKPRLRWEEHVTMDVKDIGVNTRNWFDPA